jgi:hypothetical protein
VDFGAVQTLVQPRSQQLCASQVAPSSQLASTKGLVTQVNLSLADRLKQAGGYSLLFYFANIRGQRMDVIYFCRVSRASRLCCARLFAVVDF